MFLKVTGPTSYLMVDVMDYSSQPPRMQVEHLGSFLLKHMQTRLHTSQTLLEYTPANYTNWNCDHIGTRSRSAFATTWHSRSSCGVGIIKNNQPERSLGHGGVGALLKGTIAMLWERLDPEFPFYGGSKITPELPKPGIEPVTFRSSV